MAASICSRGQGYNCSTRTMATLSAAVLVAGHQQVKSDLARGEHDTADLLGMGRPVVDDFPEGAVAELFDEAVSLTSAEVALGREQYERLARSPVDLSSQHMEKLGRCCDVCHAYVVLGAKGQEPFYASRGVLGPWPS